MGTIKRNILVVFALMTIVVIGEANAQYRPILFSSEFTDDWGRKWVLYVPKEDRFQDSGYYDYEESEPYEDPFKGAPENAEIIVIDNLYIDGRDRNPDSLYWEALD